jgi:predicted DNA-binding transcriptional regulator AlpA
MSDWLEFLEAEAGDGRFLPWREVHRTAGLSRTTAWRLQRLGQFPAPYPLSPGRVGYSEVEIAAWKRWRTALRDRKADAPASRRSARAQASNPSRSVKPPHALIEQPPSFERPPPTAKIDHAKPQDRPSRRARPRAGHPDQTVFDF